MEKNKTIEIKKGDIFKTAIELSKKEELFKNEPMMMLTATLIAGLLEEELFKEEV